MPMASAPVCSYASIRSSTPTLMPRLWTSNPLFVRMMSTRFLPMSWTSPATVANTIEPRVALSVCAIFGSRYATAAFIVCAERSTNGSCMSPDAKSSPTVFIPARSTSLTSSSGV